MNPYIPHDQWEAVAQFACDITNATGIEDWKTARFHYRRFEAYVRGQLKIGRENPYVLESLADFTDNNDKAIAIYRRALVLTRRRGTEAHTILLELGKRHLEIKGKLGLAKRYLRAAWLEARRRGDREAALEIMQIATAQLGGEAGWQGTRFHPTARRAFKRSSR